MEKNKSRFLRELFNRDTSIGELSVQFEPDTTCLLQMRRQDTRDNGEVVILTGQDTEILGYGIKREELGGQKAYQFHISYVMEYLLQNDFREDGSKTVYFPTARTGFLLTYKTLVGDAMQDKFTIKETKKNLLTKPISDFLTLLSTLSTQRETVEFHDIIDYVETQLISGHVSVSDSPMQDVLYTPQGGESPLPMYVSSSVVTELTPLLIFLRHAKMETILIEEPEISLHPELQWNMARVLIRLSNAGVPVFATTHSDIILQHVNNMIQLKYSEGREKLQEKLQYQDADLLDRERVAVYQFDVMQNRRTQVKKLACGDYGFEVMTFYRTLKALNEQIKDIEDEEG